ncbi:ABC transporter [Candidatus Nucleicultrix amoebiphila FS5]|jgi:phospholipid/cholesterol/gamma-HCH transport system ATP-binding protein|uniref:ABC transporter n=2 Tax=Candidatus Nucleicultrix TaxID=1509243 RepID=A0A1W6N5R8_9PROT|nr:ABC transporter [Candidatus Nucleicultrix amoebiphila FS5]
MMAGKIKRLTPKIALKNLDKSFGEKKVLQNISLEVFEGESLVVIGGSGTGKSVMLKCILGLLTPTAGSIKIDGVELFGAKIQVLDQVRRKISMLFQGSALFDSLPVWENIAFRLLQEKRLNRSEAKDLAVSCLSDVGLKADVAMLYPAELSGGMQRRVALARAVASKPEIIFFDEPTTGLDPIMSGVINDLIIKNVKELGATAITITHDMASARKIADRIALIHQGAIVWQGPAKDIDRSKNPYVDQFIHGSTKGPITVDVNVRA